MKTPPIVQNRTIKILIAAILCTLFLSLVYFDPFIYDVLAYHAPFSGILNNIDTLNGHSLSPFLSERFKGFPALWSYLIAPGLKYDLPRLLILPNALILLLLIIVSRKVDNNPWFLPLTSTFLYPIALFGFRSAYQDFFVGITLLISIIVFSGSIYGKIRSSSALWGSLCLFVASLVKYQSLISAFLTILAISIILVLKRNHLHPKVVTNNALALLTSIVLISIHPTINFVRFKNPVYPIQAGFFVGPEKNYTSSPVYTNVFGPFKGPLNHISSATELDWLFRGVKIKYNIDSAHSQRQEGGLLDRRKFFGDGVESDTGIVRTGGSFGPTYSIVLVGFIITALKNWRSNYSDNSKSITPLDAYDLFVCVYLFNLFSPQAHELRYYLFLLFLPAYYFLSSLWRQNQRIYIYICLILTLVSLVLNFAQPIKTTLIDRGFVYAKLYPIRDLPSVKQCKQSKEMPPIDQFACLIVKKKLLH